MRERARPGSFVRHAVYSVQDVLDEIATNPTAAKRYANHFGVSQSQIAEYFRQNLKVVTLSAPAKVTTYFVSKNNRVLSKQRTLPAGRQVFVGPGNKPLLEISCGNPVTKSLPVVKTEVKPVVETIGSIPIAEEVAPEVVLAPAVEPAPPVVVAALPITQVIPTVESFSAGRVFEIAAAVAAPLAGLHYVQASKDTYIPEPSSLAVLSFGTLGMASAFVRSRRLRKR